MVSARARLLCSNMLVESDVWREDRCGDKGREEEERKRKKPKVNEKKKTKVKEKKKEGDNEEKEEEEVKGDGLVASATATAAGGVMPCKAGKSFFIGAGGGGNALVSPLTLIGPVASVTAVLAFGQSTLDCELYTIFSQLRPGYPPIIVQHLSVWPAQNHLLPFIFQWVHFHLCITRSFFNCFPYCRR